MSDPLLLRPTDGSNPRALPTAYDFAAVFDHAGLGMVIADTDGRILRVNDAYARLVGRAPAELIGQTAASFTHPEDIDLAPIALQEAERTTTASLTFEKRYIRPDGSIVWARITLAPAYDDPAGRFVIGTAENITEQKEIREELIETRRRVSSALIAGEVATYEWDVKGDRLWGDANFDRIFGTTRDADGTAPLARFVQSIHPSDRERVMQAVLHTVQTGAEYDTEYRIRTGEIERWVSARGRLAPADDHGVVRFHGVVLDITERKKAQQELELRTRLYDTFLSGTDDLAYLIDREGRFVFVNRALLELWGMTPEQALGKTLYELGYPEWHADRNMREFAEVFATKRGLTGEVPYVSPTGVAGIYEYVFSPVLDAHGEVEFIAGTSRDVAERRKAEELQRRLAAQLTLALEAAHMGWWQYDIRNGRVFLDSRTMSIFEVTQQEHDLGELLGRMVAEDAAAVRRAMRLATDPDDPQPYEVEYRLQMPDGGFRWIVSKGLAIFDGEEADRRAIAFVGTALDVTETKAAQEALHGLLESERVARSEAERASHMKDEFLATLSHELRTPLAAILGWAQILGAGGTSAEDLSDGIEVIGRNARAQAQIIEDLLEMSRIVSGKIRLDVEPVELGSIVRAAVGTVQTAADAKAVRMAIHEKPQGLRISGDESRLHQVFWNLLSNAVKFTSPGGAIDVRIEHVDSHVEVTVRDTGEGIHPDFLPYVFDRFRQADASTTRRHGGLGLGLAIVKQLVELHGGSVRVSSEGPGKGTTFTVMLPVVALQQPREVDDTTSDRRRHQADPLSETRIDGVRVLVVDDDEDARFVVLRLLQSRGAVVAQAASVAEGLEILASSGYDVLVCDIGMPGEDGYSMIRRLRAAANPVSAIALTAYARETDRDRAIAAGFQEHLAKPVGPAELVAAVANLAAR